MKMNKNKADIPEKKSDIDKDEETIDSGEDNLLGIDEDSSESQGLETQGNEEALTKNLDDMQAEIDSLKDQHLRLTAEFTNYRRRSSMELSEAWVKGQSELLRNFLDGLDDLQRVVTSQQESTTVESLIEGMNLIAQKFLKALDFSGVEVIEPKGQEFNPSTMEAMVTVATESPEDDNLVQDVFQKGYLFKGHLVRPARVSVYKHE
tara:strand:- start:3264 stop:3881 length:618 start_codon:yes stop_codon:yes gene_type:complete